VRRSASTASRSQRSGAPVMEAKNTFIYGRVFNTLKTDRFVEPGRDSVCRSLQCSIQNMSAPRSRPQFLQRYVHHGQVFDFAPIRSYSRVSGAPLMLCATTEAQATRLTTSQISGSLSLCSIIAA
jgi:hypothetical protein